MPSGRTHTAATLGLSVVSTAALLAAGAPGNAALHVLIGCLSGVLISPDLDVDEGYFGNAIVRRYLGGFASWIWQTLWHPYAKLASHRSVLSHFPLIGTFIRLFYLYFWYQAFVMTLNVALFLVAPGSHVSTYDVPWREVLRAVSGSYTWTFSAVNACSSLLGLCGADALHAVMDVVSTQLKHVRRKNARLHVPLSEM